MSILANSEQKNQKLFTRIQNSLLFIWFRVALKKRKLLQTLIIKNRKFVEQSFQNRQDGDKSSNLSTDHTESYNR